MSPQQNPQPQKHAAGANINLHKAASHPLRYRMLLALGEREASPSDLSEQLDEDLHRICEQMEILKKYDCVEFVRIEHGANGRARHIYRASARPTFDAQEWEALPQLSRESASGSILQIAISDIAAAVASGAFDAHPRRALLQKPVIVDEQGFADLDDSALHHLANTERIAAESSERRAKSGDPGIRVKTLTIVHEAAALDSD